MDRRTSIRLIGGAAAAVAAGATRARAARPELRPNLVLVIVDDLRWDEFGAAGHPYLKTPHVDRLAREGASFSRAFHATPLCSPNRACLLTGQYVARHAVYNNADRSLLSHQLRTFPQELRRAGYATAHVGKWHMGNDPSARPGFDFWVSFPGQGRTEDPELFEDGQLRKAQGYVTDLLTDRALQFLRAQRGAGRPFCLYLAHKAVHPDAIQRGDGSLDTQYGSRYIAAPRHRGRYASEVFPRTGAKTPAQGVMGSAMVRRFLERKGSEPVVREFGAMLEPGMTEQSIRDRAEMVLSVDESLGRLLAELEDARALENTVVVFGSDNGFFFGEHGLSIERRLPYEESIRAPLLVCHPARVEAGTTIDTLVSSIDVAPTLLELAGAAVGPHVQGRSFAPWLTRGGSRPAGRESVLIENYSDDRPFPWLLDADYKAIRTHRHKLIHWTQAPGFDELYDLAADPREERNLIDDPANRSVLADLRGRLGRLVLESVGLG